MILELLDTDLVIWMLDNPLYHTMKSDPRREFRDMYESDNRKFFQLTQWDEVNESNQATIFTQLVYAREITLSILQGKPPNRRQLDENFVLLACGHFLGINDFLSKGFTTYLARMMDHGIVSKIYSKYYLSNGKISLYLA